MKALLICLLLLAGCSSNTVFGLALFAASIHEYAFADYPPEMDPNRRVSEQDCTKPLDYSLGNIRCK